MDDTPSRPADATPDLAGPTLTAQARARQAAREARQSAALRENLRRRRQQSRAREEPAADLPDPSHLG